MTTNNFEFLAGALFGFLIAAMILMVAMSVMYAMGLWRTLQRMGRHDFAALVPFYAQWEMARGAGFGTGLCVLYVSTLVGSFLCMSLTASMAGTDSLTYQMQDLLYQNAEGFIEGLMAWSADYTQAYGNQALWLTVLTAIFQGVYVVLTLCLCYGIARSFGHGFVYTFGLFLFPFVFFLALGYGSRQTYRGPYFQRFLNLTCSADWAALIKARKETFGSNAPLALACLGLVFSLAFMPVVGVVLALVAVIKNASKKDKPLYGGKFKAVSLTAFLCFVFSCLTTLIILMSDLSVSFVSF